MSKEERFLPPRAGAGKGVLPRARVNAVLDAAKARGGRWVYAGAPGGFGKSLAVSRWLLPQRNKHAWITLDPYDNNEGRFVRKFLGGLAFAQRANRKLARAAGRVHPPFLEYLLDTVDLLLPNEKQYVLVLDDFHHLREESLLRAFPLIHGRLPSGFTVCLLGRDDPPDVFLDWILKDEMTVLSARDLAFDEEELRRILSRNGLSPQQAPDLLRRTAGWPIAVGAFLMGSGRDKASPDEPLREGERLHRYLDAHVWNGWDRTTQDFLMRLSRADHLDERLCRRLTGRSDSAKRLEDLSRNLAFVSRLGDGRLRLHDLFRDFLQEKLAQNLDATEIRALDKKLADALLEEGDCYAAAANYIRCADSEGLSACCAAFRQAAIHDSIEDRIAFFREYVIGRHQALFEGNLRVLAQCALVHYLNGDAREFLRLMDRIRREMTEEDWDLLQLVWGLRALDFRKPLGAYIDEFLEERKRLEHALPGNRIHIGTFTAAMPLLHRSLKEFSDLARGGRYGEGLARKQKACTPFLGEEHVAILECQRAGIFYECGDPSAACAHALKAQRIIEGKPCRAEIRFSADLILSAILREMGRRDEALRIETEAERRIEREGQLPLRPGLRAWRYATRIAEGDVSAAREWLDAHAAPLDGKPPLYRMYQHFVTERALIAVREDALAVLFGEKLLRLGMDFRRRLDIIEASLLLAIAHRNLGNRRQSLLRMKRALKLASLCGFSRLFLNDAPALTPILDSLLRSLKTHPSPWVEFAVRVRAAMTERAAPPAPPAKPNGAPLPHLSARQRRILELLGQNASYGEIAASLGVAHSTAKYHVLRLYRTLGVSGAAEALARAGQSGNGTGF